MISKKIFTMFSVSMLILFISVGTAMAGTDEEDKELVIKEGNGNVKDDSTKETTSENGDSFLDEQVNKMDPAIQPFARIVANNLTLIFNFVGGAAILGFGLWAAIEKKRGHTQQAAEAKHTAVDVTKTLLIALVLFNIFVALCKSSTFGI